MGDARGTTEGGNGQGHDRCDPNDTPFGIPRAVGLDDRSLGPHHGAAHPRADPGQKQDPAKVTTCVPAPSKYPAPLVPGLRPVSIKGIQAALRAARTLP